MSKYDICIIGGLGHIGLPLGVLFADSGKTVVAYDLYQPSIDAVLSGKTPFIEEGMPEILSRVLNKTFFISSNKEVISKSHFIVIVIGTPADRHLNPEFTKFQNFFNDILELLQNDQHIILRSTVFPGTTEKIKRYLESKGKFVKISFCPERIAEGMAIHELRVLPQLIGVFDGNSAKELKELFLTLTKEVIFLSPLEAELAKLFTNIWRYIQFSIANQFYQITTENEVDFYKVYDAMVCKYPRAKDFARAGFAAGPCLFKDTAHLISYTGNTFFLGNAAMLINEGLPNFIVQRLKRKYSIVDKTIGILGMAFKANIDDKRDSLSFKLKNILEMETRTVLCSDVYIKHAGFVSPEELISRSDIIILGAPHREYAGLKIGKDKILVDIWNFFGKGGLF